VSKLQHEIIEVLREDFIMLEVRLRIKEKGAPYVVFVLQELERMNKILTAIRMQLNELALGLSGALNISDAMDGLINAMSMNQVPPNWLKTCGQIGPTGTYNRKSLSSWYTDLQLRWQQLEVWSAPTKPVEECPPSVWIAGTFNSMGYVTATLQVTARATGESLDAMKVHVEVTKVTVPPGASVDAEIVAAQPSSGTYVHGFYMEGARWDLDADSVAESKPKELYPYMPMLHITGRTVENAIPQDIIVDGWYICPFYMTTIRGPTFIFSGPMRTNAHPFKWILAGACLVMQPD